MSPREGRSCPKKHEIKRNKEKNIIQALAFTGTKRWELATKRAVTKTLTFERREMKREKRK